MELALKVALPLLLVGLAVGLIVSVFQAVTQIQEQTLTFIPKILATVVVMVVGGPWMLDQLLSYTRDLWTVDPDPHRLTRVTVQQLIAQFGEQQVVGLLRSSSPGSRRCSSSPRCSRASRSRRACAASSPSRSPSA